MVENLDNESFMVYAARYYISPHYIEQEFFNDLKRLKYIKRLIQRYRNTGEIKERLVLNHIIMLYNVFETYACTKLLFFKLNPEDYSTIKTFLLYLGYMPDIIININNKNIFSTSIPINEEINTILEQL